MTEYSYVVQTASCRIERGRIQAASAADVQNQFKQNGCRLVGIEEISGKTTGVASLRKSFGTPLQIPFFGSIRSGDIELWLLQLSVMLESGLKLAPALDELRQHSPKPRVQQLSADLFDAIQKGDCFSEALTNSKCFPTIVAPLVQVGEESGALAPTLRRAAEFIEKRRRAITNLLSTLAYPMFVAIAACAVAFFLVGWAIPKMATFLDAMGRKLPSMTQSLLDVAALIKSIGPTLGVLAVAGIVAFVLIYRWRPGRYRIDQVLLRIPLLGPLFQITETQQLASSLALLLRSGVFLQDALGTAAKLNRNRYLAGEVIQSREAISQGQDLAGSLRGRGFGPMLASMVAVGERTGELPKTLDHVSEFYGGQIEAQLNRIGKLIEPTIIVVVGGLVGYVYIAFFMALMSAGGKF